jgi:hypothetical protein
LEVKTACAACEHCYTEHLLQVSGIGQAVAMARGEGGGPRSTNASM